MCQLPKRVQFLRQRESAQTKPSTEWDAFTPLFVFLTGIPFLLKKEKLKKGTAVIVSANNSNRIIISAGQKSEGTGVHSL